MRHQLFRPALLCIASTLAACSLVIAPDETIPQNSEDGVGTGGSGGLSAEAGAPGDEDPSGGTSSASGGRPNSRGTGGVPGVGGDPSGGAPSSGGGTDTGGGGGTLTCDPGRCGVDCLPCDPVISGAGSTEHTCFLHESGRLACIGWNYRGELGRPEAVSPAFPLAPPTEPQPMLLGPEEFSATAVGATLRVTCAADQDGKLWCVGDDNHTLLGAGGVGATPVLQRVISSDASFEDRTFSELSFSFYAACALDEQGDVWCWGNAAYGAGSANSDRAQRLTFSDKVKALGGSNFAHCALLEDESVHCWGQDNYRQLGRAVAGNSLTPGPVQGLPLIKKLVTKGGTHCGISRADDLYCWGWNVAGVIDEDDAAATAIPVPQIVASDVKDAWVNNYSLCYQTEGQAFCRGSYHDGAVGNGLLVGSADDGPVRVAELDDIDVLFTAGNHACGQRDDELFCWGEFVHGGVPGSFSILPTATRVVDAIGSPATDITGIGLSAQTGGCATTSDNSVRCWGSYATRGVVATGSSAQPDVVLGMTAPRDITNGYNHACVLDDRSSVGAEVEAKCWSNSVPTPVKIPLPAEPTDIDAGRLFRCVVLGSGPFSSGEVYCWGSSSDGKLGFTPGVSTTTAPLSPVGGLTDAVEVSAGVNHACALREGGLVSCWGKGAVGQLGDGSSTNSTTPLQVTGMNNAIQVSAGNDTSCAVLSTGEIKCWGEGQFGRLGNGGTTRSSTPASVTAVGVRATSVSVGYWHACAAYEDGTARCWGGNRFGQVSGAAGEEVLHPRLVEGVSGAVSVDTNQEIGFGSCAVGSSGAAWCWGLNSFSGLGSGSALHLLTPSVMTPLL